MVDTPLSLDDLFHGTSIIKMNDLWVALFLGNLGNLDFYG